MSDEPGEMFRATPARPRPPRTFRPGDVVRAPSGPSAALAGRVEGANRAQRPPRARVEVFGRVTPLKLGRAEVEQVFLP